MNTQTPQRTCGLMFLSVAYFCNGKPLENHLMIMQEEYFPEFVDVIPREKNHIEADL